MPTPRMAAWALLVCVLLWSGPAFGATVSPATDPPVAKPAGQEEHEPHEQEQTEEQGAGEQEPPEIETPPLPEGMTLEQVLEYSAGAPPGHFPDPVPDDATYAFLLVDQLEYRFANEPTADHLGWETQGWIGGDYHKLWLKSEGEVVFQGPGEGESETDLLYSRLISPFWSAQAGIQYANGWSPGSYEDRWSAVLALQGLAPYKFEVDSSLYLSTDGDLTLEVEAEYGIRVTQRLVLQPRTELVLSAQDVPERRLGSGFAEAKLDLRLRYELRRDLAPYLGVRWRFLAGETGDLAEASGGRTKQRYIVAGLRLAF